MDLKNKDFSSVDKKYLPIPFWSLNDRLTKEETERLIGEMDSSDIGGFFLHARGGLETPYMGEEWFDNINYAVAEGKKRSMAPFAYDENGWPSGFADGRVPALGEKYMLKSLCRTKGAYDGKRIAEINGFTYFADINPLYSDLLDPEVTEKFIEFSYQPYIDKAPDIDGFFTDEPQLARMRGIPWSDTLPSEWKKAYGTDILPLLPCLFEDCEGASCVRIKYWRLVATLFSESYAKTIHEFCEKHNKKFTGHLLLEEDMRLQMISNGAVMPSYQYFDIPGIDMLTLIKEPGTAIIAPYQVASVAHQFGKKAVLTESFAACGHGADFDDLAAVFSWQAVRGATLLCLHLSPYSMRGLRKRDYPPAIGPQQPWWDYFHGFCDSAGRLGALLSEGRTEFDTLVLHPMTSCWAAFTPDNFDRVYEIQGSFTRLLYDLEAKHVLFDLGDEIIMARHALVSGGKLKVGECSYDRVIVPFGENLLPETRRLLSEFESQGGTVLKDARAVPDSKIASDPCVTYTRRLFDNFTFHYFVNSTPEEKSFTVSVGNKLLDLETGALSPFSGNMTLPPFGSAAIIEDSVREPVIEKKPPEKVLDLSGEWQIEKMTDNALTLDRCTVNGREDYVLNVFTRAMMNKESETECTFKFFIEKMPPELYLGIETPEKFGIKVNSSDLKKEPTGEFFDRSVKLFDISELAVEGENTVSITAHLRQSDEIYEKIGRTKIFETETNSLKYDTELESIYLVGPFGVSAAGFSDVSEKITRTDGGFKITALPESVTLSELEKQGFPFFSGSITLKKTVTLKDTFYLFRAVKKGLHAVTLTVNGAKVKTFIKAPYEADISSFLKEGENEISLTLTNNLRNLLGPHHLPSPDEHCISPGSFYEEKNPFLPGGGERIGGYNLFITGLF